MKNELFIEQIEEAVSLFFFLLDLCFAEGLWRFLGRGDMGSWYLYWEISSSLVAGTRPHPEPPLSVKPAQVSSQSPWPFSNFPTSDNKPEKEIQLKLIAKVGIQGPVASPPLLSECSVILSAMPPALILLLISCLAKIMLSAKYRGK